MATERVKEGSILLTGPNGGIGMGFVHQLLKSPYASTHPTIYAVRDPAKSHALNTALKTAPETHDHRLLSVDFSSLASIRSFASNVNKLVSTGTVPPISALVLNAGIQDTASEHFTVDGFERVFAVNYLAIFLVSLLLLESMDKDHGRIIFVGSTGADIDWFINGANFSSEEQKKSLVTDVESMSKGIEMHPDGDVLKTGMRRYALSKILCMKWMYELQRRLDADPSLHNISVLGHDPGWVGGTGMVRNVPWKVKITLGIIIWALGYIVAPFSSNPLIRTASANGNFLLMACFDTAVFGDRPKAKYLNGAVVGTTPPLANDEVKQKELWKGSLDLAGVKDGDTVLKNWR